MNLKNNEIIENMIFTIEKKIIEIDKKIDYNNRCIKEAESYINTFIASEPVDFKFFSPRNAEYIYKEEINKTEIERSNFKNENDELEKKRKLLSEQLVQLKSLLVPKDYGLTLLDLQEHDRQRIARDLHDTSLQNLTHLIHRIELSNLYIDKDPTKAKLELSVISKILKETIEEIRNIVFDLRPMTLDDLGLKAAIESAIDNLNESGQYSIEKDIDEVPCENNLLLVSIYRIVQECFHNIKKHSDSEKVIIKCKYIDNNYIIDIKDNGKGFQKKSVKNTDKHFGLSLMKERIELLNGIIKITSKKDKGTTIHIEIPI